MSPTPAPAARAGEELPSTEVVVVRHGETAWNASRVVQVRPPVARCRLPSLPSFLLSPACMLIHRFHG
jgi:hypothetical protein